MRNSTYNYMFEYEIDITYIIYYSANPFLIFNFIISFKLKIHDSPQLFNTFLMV